MRKKRKELIRLAVACIVVLCYGIAQAGPPAPPVSDVIVDNFRGTLRNQIGQPLSITPDPAKDNCRCAHDATFLCGDTLPCPIDLGTGLPYQCVCMSDVPGTRCQGGPPDGAVFPCTIDTAGAPSPECPLQDCHPTTKKCRFDETSCATSADCANQPCTEAVDSFLLDISVGDPNGVHILTLTKDPPEVSPSVGCSTAGTALPFAVTIVTRSALNQPARGKLYTDGIDEFGNPVDVDVIFCTTCPGGSSCTTRKRLAGSCSITTTERCCMDSECPGGETCIGATTTPLIFDPLLITNNVPNGDGVPDGDGSQYLMFPLDISSDTYLALDTCPFCPASCSISGDHCCLDRDCPAGETCNISSPTFTIAIPIEFVLTTAKAKNTIVSGAQYPGGASSPMNGVRTEPHREAEFGKPADNTGRVELVAVDSFLNKPTGNLLVQVVDVRALLSRETVPRGPDADGDDIIDVFDNCTVDKNGFPEGVGGNIGPPAADDDEDGIGDVCDCDYDQNNTCGFPDFNVFLGCFGQAVPGAGPADDPNCEESDQDGNETVGFADFTLFLNGFGGPPGPSWILP